MTTEAVENIEAILMVNKKMTKFCPFVEMAASVYLSLTLYILA